jgi:hypothetical protein
MAAKAIAKKKTATKRGTTAKKLTKKAVGAKKKIAVAKKRGRKSVAKANSLYM